MILSKRRLSRQLACCWLLVLSVNALSFSALAKQAVDETMVTENSPNVEIEHVNGTAIIKGWDKQEIKITGELGDNTEDFTFSKDGNDVLIKVDVKRFQDDWKNSSIDKGDRLTIYLPVASRVSYTAVHADLEISEINNDTRVELINGDIKANTLSGRVKLETVNGDVSLTDIQGVLVVESVNGDIEGNHQGNKDARLVTVNGDIRINTNSPEVRVESVNGNMDITLAKVRELDIVTVNGEVNVKLELAENGDVSATSVGGGLQLSFQKNVSARFDVEAHAGGEIINRISSDKMRSAKYGPNKWLEFTQHGGAGRVEISTVHGKVDLSVY
ncbi:hypothetical protein CA267_011520 [Alteromonas pelagimontana]|uniref:DUF4097 domain-containing protein n=1 Tax=Alteromonas pelagimontana TaxID=1858656 RepID=A0A6M4MDU2_9ALTE|nr:DUF4097 family beta strand repeat-containing protein [Alteromonas pelagimontana]QJR81361.1 hypothetical protein CA267_011520 [Alteromonas pelagimontana]